MAQTATFTVEVQLSPFGEQDDYIAYCKEWSEEIPGGVSQTEFAFGDSLEEAAKNAIAERFKVR